MRYSVVLVCFAIYSLMAVSFVIGQDGGMEEDARPGLYDSVWPHGRSDAWRTGAAIGAGLPEDIDSDSLVTMSVELPTAPTWGVVYSEDAIFAFGGSPFLLKEFAYATAADSGASPSENAQRAIQAQAIASAAVHPYVAKIDPHTMSVIDMIEFPLGNTVNYVASMLIHENGKLYTAATSTLYEVDPETMEITGSLALPQYDTQSGATVYNTLQVSPTNGDIIIKATNIADQSLPSRLVSVDPTDLSIRYQLETPIGATRLAVASQGDTNYAYLSNDTQTLRFIIGEDGFEADDAWSKVYRTEGDGTTGAVSMVYMPVQDTVVFANNNTVIYGVTAPLQLFTQATDTTEGSVISLNATSSTNPGGSFFSAAADPFNSQMVVANDQINGTMAGWLLEDDGTLTKVWETDQYHSSGGTAIGSDQGHFYLDDRRCDETGSNCELYLVILDITTGDQLAEAKVAGSGPTIAQIFLSENAAYFIATEPGDDKGFVTRVSAE